MNLTATPRGLSVGQAAPNAFLQTCQGERIALADLWRSSPLLLQFARHLGCPFCRDRASRLRIEYPEIQRQGGDVVFITMGPRERAQQLQDTMRLPFDVLVDPHRSAYQAYRVPRGNFSQVAGPQIWLPGLNATLRSGLGKPTGDLLQMQGTFVVDANGILKLAHVPRNSADHPALADILTALQS